MESIATTLLTILIAPVIMAWVGTKQEITLKKALAQIEQQGKDADAKRDAARAETQAKRAAEAEWREAVERRMDAFEQELRTMNDKVDSTLRGQLTQMRSDIVHKSHRYLDDLGCASTEEKQAYDEEYKEYAGLCEASGIKNDFVVGLHEQVMALPGRAIGTKTVQG